MELAVETLIVGVETVVIENALKSSTGNNHWQRGG
jgi:hypothetical protein